MSVTAPLRSAKTLHTLNRVSKLKDQYAMQDAMKKLEQAEQEQARCEQLLSQTQAFLAENENLNNPELFTFGREQLQKLFDLVNESKTLVSVAKKAQAASLDAFVLAAVRLEKATVKLVQVKYETELALEKKERDLMPEVGGV